MGNPEHGGWMMKLRNKIFHYFYYYYYYSFSGGKKTVSWLGGHISERDLFDIKGLLLSWRKNSGESLVGRF